MTYPDCRRPERILDPPGEDSEFAGPAAVVGHNGQTAGQFIREGHPASLNPVIEGQTSPDGPGKGPSFCPSTSRIVLNLPRLGLELTPAVNGLFQRQSGNILRTQASGVNQPIG